LPRRISRIIGWRDVSLFVVVVTSIVIVDVVSVVFAISRHVGCGFSKAVGSGEEGDGEGVRLYTVCGGLGVMVSDVVVSEGEVVKCRGCDIS
jgi:hypothetical protein